MYLACAERSIYWIIWILGLFYAFYQFIQVCQTSIHHYRLDLKLGTLVKNPYDSTDLEWQTFKRLYTNYWYIIAFHFISSNIFTAAKLPTLKLVSWVFITLYAAYTVFSFSALVVISINVMMLIPLATFGQYALSYVLCAGVILATHSAEIADRIFDPNDPRQTNEFDFEEKRLLFTYCVCFLNVRGLSSASDNLGMPQKKEIRASKKQTYQKMLTIAAYLLYLPGFFFGPIFMYNDFEQSSQKVTAEPNMATFMGKNYRKSMLRLLMLIGKLIYYEYLLHWAYSSALNNHYNLVAMYDPWEFSGYIVSLCLMFFLKYCCIYDTFRVLATFDGLSKMAPSLPRCPAVMHSNTTLWRKFDVGMYKWLREYLYDPITELNPTTIGRISATVVCFNFTGLWHFPVNQVPIMWLGLNCIIATLEIWARSTGKTKFWVKNVQKKLSEPAYLRLLAFISVPNFMLAIYANLFFLSNGEDVSSDFISRLLYNYDDFAYIILFLYCGANVSLDYNGIMDGATDFFESHCKLKWSPRKKPPTSQPKGIRNIQSKKTR